MLNTLRSFFEVFADLLNLNPTERQFRKIQSRRKISNNADKVIYVEALQTPLSQVALTYFLPVLAIQTSARLACYKFIHPHWYSGLTQRVIHKFSILSALGAREILLLKSGKKIPADHKRKFESIKSEREFLNFEYSGISIGDLIYDTYLNERHRPTLDLLDPALLQIFSDSCSIVDYWEKLILDQEIASLCVGHAVYKNGIPARVCLKNGIPVYQVNLNSIYKLNTERCLAHFDFLDYPEIFQELSLESRAVALHEAEERLSSRLKGNPAPELSYMPVSAHSRINGAEIPVLALNNKFKVLVATHDFFDSPHCNGETIFEDFLIWLNNIGELSKRTNFDWYIKNHPFLRGDGERVVDDFVSQYPHITKIPSSTSHQQIVNEGIDAVLTVYGTIASEYAYLGLKAVNACITNPHSAFNFTFNPRNSSQFEKLVLNLDSEHIQIKRSEVLEFFYMHYLHYKSSWLLPNDEALTSILIDTNPRRQKIRIFAYTSKLQNEFQLITINQHIERALLIGNYRLDSVIPRR